MVDSNRGDAFVVDSRGVLLALFDTTPFSTEPRDIAFDSTSGRFAIVDNLSNLVTVLDLPGLFMMPELCACDLNNDGVCDMSDYFRFGLDWRNTNCP
jgi:hypothetical protein